MTQLVCAACAHPVEEGRCPTCRLSRLQFQPPGGLTPEIFVLLVALLVAVAIAIAHLGA